VRTLCAHHGEIVAQRGEIDDGASGVEHRIGSSESGRPRLYSLAHVDAFAIVRPHALLSLLID
jgi:hypothetical protein